MVSATIETNSGRDILIPPIMTKKRRDTVYGPPNNTIVLRPQKSRTKPQKRGGGLNTPTHQRMPRDGLNPTRGFGPILQMMVRKGLLNTPSIAPNSRVRTS
jgi:hypothetical protein